MSQNLPWPRCRAGFERLRGNFHGAQSHKQTAMSKDDRFAGIDWQDVLYRLTVRARQLFAVARLKGRAAALSSTGVIADDLAQTVLLEALRGEKVKFRPGGASVVTFLSHVLENDFKDLLRKGTHRLKVTQVLDPAAEKEKDNPQHAQIVSDVGDCEAGAKRVEIRAVLLDLVKGDSELEEYVIAVVDCGAKKPSDQATLLSVSSAEITNRRKRLLRLVAAKTPGVAKVRP
jgi:DNA-directed RNA polymerase specialized sigma24 family protein